jgi:hypothetical protein
MDLNEFVKALARSVQESIRRNKLPASLSLIALILTTALALTSDYDERPRYRRTILPEIHKAEMQFFDVMHLAETEQAEPERTLYFIEAHRRAKSVLRVIRSERPLTPAGKNAQLELARYYDLVDEELSIIRTQMSNDETYDYIAEWKRSNASLQQIRANWLKWLNAASG